MTEIISGSFKEKKGEGGGVHIKLTTYKTPEQHFMAS